MPIPNIRDSEFYKFLKIRKSGRDLLQINCLSQYPIRFLIKIVCTLTFQLFNRIILGDLKGKFSKRASRKGFGIQGIWNFVGFFLKVVLLLINSFLTIFNTFLQQSVNCFIGVHHHFAISLHFCFKNFNSASDNLATCSSFIP